jgi:serine/threonine-protein kinase
VAQQGEELDRALAKRWSFIEPHADTIEQAPQHTIRPAHLTPDTAGRRAIEALRQLAERRIDAALTVEQTLGEGGMGIVRLGTQASLGRRVAVKTLKQEHRGERQALKLLQEAWVTGTLEHPNVVPVYDVGFDGAGAPQIVLKRIEGVSWSELRRTPGEIERRFGADRLESELRILMQVSNAIHFAHSRGIVHRDIKPDNVMIGEFGEVYVMDWGIAVSLKDDASGRLPLAKAAIEMAGTPAYMAPEMLGGRESRLSERSDVYLLGATLYEIITGHPPHQGDTVMKVVHSIASSEPSFPDGAPEELVQICRKAMAADQDARFDSAEALRVAVQRFLEHRGSAVLAAEAEEQLENLGRHLERRSTHDVAERGEEERLVIYSLFGQCRFGFQQALRTWSDNDAARLGLRRAIEAMIDFELREGDARAAATLLADLDEPPAALRTRVEEALRAREEEQRRIRELEQLGREMDKSIGARTRTGITVILGTLWTVFPLVIQKYAVGRIEVESYPRTIGWSAGFLVLVLVLAAWARESMFKTAINRRIIATVVIALIAMIAMNVSGWVLGVEPARTHILHFVLWFAVAAMGALAIDVRLWPTAAGFLVGLGLATAWPEYRFAWMSVGNAVLTVNAFLLWRRLFRFRRRDAGER